MKIKNKILAGGDYTFNFLIRFGKDFFSPYPENKNIRLLLSPFLLHSERCGR